MWMTSCDVLSVAVIRARIVNLKLVNEFSSGETAVKVNSIRSAGLDLLMLC